MNSQTVAGVAIIVCATIYFAVLVQGGWLKGSRDVKGRIIALSFLTAFSLFLMWFGLGLTFPHSTILDSTLGAITVAGLVTTSLLLHWRKVHQPQLDATGVLLHQAVNNVVFGALLLVLAGCGFGLLFFLSRILGPR